ncbi:MAG: pseudoazurin [Pseudomonadota bacterium]
MRDLLNSPVRALLSASAFALLAACGGGSEEPAAQAEDAAEKAEEAADTAAEAAEAADDAQEAAADAADEAASAADTAVDTAEDAADAAADAANDAAGSAMDAAEDLVDDVEEAVDEAVDEAGDQAAEAVSDGAAKVANIGAAAAGAAGAAGAAVANAAGSAADSAGEVVNAAAETVEDAAGATTHEVKMLNAHPDNPRQRMVYVPRVLSVKPGDTITFISSDPGHNTQSTNGMIPDGAESWKSKAGQDFSVTLTEPGIYGYNCQPHVAAGMVGLIVVEGEGKTANLEAAKSVNQIGLAKRVWGEIWGEAEAQGIL